VGVVQLDVQADDGDEEGPACGEKRSEDRGRRERRISSRIRRDEFLMDDGEDEAFGSNEARADVVADTDAAVAATAAAGDGGDGDDAG